MKNPLLDLDFLRQLDLQRNKTVYAKVILLTFNDETPIEEVQGKITSGSVSVDGASAVRRTCSLSMVTLDKNINDIYWALNNKFKLEVGIENHINDEYPDIIWFKQGTYVFTSISMNVQANNYTINLSGKDKMCLLNGEVGGSINASTDFGTIEEYSGSGLNMVSTITHIPIVEIIKNAVHVYGGEPLSNIIINDVDNYGLELLEYRGNKNMYMIRDKSTQTVNNITFNEKQKYKKEDGSQVALKDVESYYKLFDSLDINFETKDDNATDIYPLEGEDGPYNAIKIEYGDAAGYRKTDLTYPGDLIANVGESLTAVLDKIKSTFSDFEYFYDIDGRFVFQKKKTYMNESWNNLSVSETEIYAQDSMLTSSYTYSFEDGILLTAFNNNPNITNIKNDFSIWGKRKGITGTEIPVHMRYAIHKKPEFYRPLRFDDQGNQLNNEEVEPFLAKGSENYSVDYIPAPDVNEENFYDKKYYIYNESEKAYERQSEYRENQSYFTKEYIINNRYDWRELIYQMGKDYMQYNHKYDNFTQLIAAANPEHYPTGVTGYEEFYTDVVSFWREIYNPNAIGEQQFEYIKVNETPTSFVNIWYKDNYGQLWKFLPGITDKVHQNPEIYTYNDGNRIYELYDKSINKNGSAKFYESDLPADLQGKLWLKTSGTYTEVPRYRFADSDTKKERPISLYNENNMPLHEYYYRERKYEEKGALTEAQFNTGINRGKKYCIKDANNQYIEVETYSKKQMQYDAFYTIIANTNPAQYEKVSITQDDFTSALENSKNTKYYVKLKNGTYINPTVFSFETDEIFYEIKDEYYLEEKVMTWQQFNSKTYYKLTYEGGKAKFVKLEIAKDDFKDPFYYFKDGKFIAEQEKITETKFKSNHYFTLESDYTKSEQMIYTEIPYNYYYKKNGKFVLEEVKLSKINFETQRTKRGGYYLESENGTYVEATTFQSSSKLIDYYEQSGDRYIKVDQSKITEEDVKAGKYYIKAERTLITYYDMTQTKSEFDFYKEVELDYVTLTTSENSIGTYNKDTGFSTAVMYSPETLNFWIDFMDIDGSLGQYSISAIGNRSKAVNNDKVKAIYYKDIPNVLFVSKADENDLNINLKDYNSMTGYTFINLANSQEEYFTISARGMSAQDELNSLLYQHTHANDSVTLTAIPIYHLQSNTRIFVKDNATGINGEYIISKITIPLTYNGTTSITATKAVDRIY